MDDFKASCPEQRGPANPNVEYIPFEEMKQRILKIVNGYSGIPFTIQRLCELLTEPKRNYTGTDKFLRGMEKNVMVVSCVYPTSEKKGSGCVNRMNGVMFPGNTSAFPDRNVNGPGTPRPLNRTKLSLSSSAATNGLPDSTESKEQASESSERTVNETSESEAKGSHSGPVKSKHCEDEDATNAETHEAKRLKFDKEEEDDDEDEMEKEQDGKDSPCTAVAESSSDVPESTSDVSAEVKDNKPDEFSTEDQEPSSTQSESLENGDDKSACEDSPSTSHNQETGSELDLPEEQLPEREESTEAQEIEERNDPVSSSSNNSSDEGVSSADTPSASPSSSTELPAEGSSSADISSDTSETAEDTMEQD
ncbi:serine/threonine-protein phosphatase 4 regulatory subunit 2-A-like isoform X2 [Myxocyprinus asiaticus]|nr:serine/threonine-protein phosphatase 4 regulatory subunit 2-A-like isoform X2 [Myxocyprinus asiaticus]XP_051515375.1 serine/threonine-protein phosphatase 4 regulatory subunit 2-A-like isoform X2 [Myxocyprinus asiaticus]XP_051515377.1 serine/threonine-protein phosphatase 4 regulatory subunit 2-A-like isoform X2 [Myxocyprinus asiaticus]